MANFIETTPTSTAVLKFVDCCDQSVIFFRGTINLVPGTNVFSYTGSTPFVGSGGSLQIGRCYTVTQEYVSTPITYPAAPVEAQLSPKQDCTDLKCLPCENPKTCNCPEGFRESEGNLCIKTVTTAADYSGQLFTLTAGSKSQYYCDSGLRLYPDITSLTWPIYGDGTSNATYTVKQNNGSGPLVAAIADVQSQVWGKGSNPCWTSTTGGRLNIAGVWAAGFPDNKELAFEYCITVTGDSDKQYMIGIAGDNYVKFYIDGNLAVFLDAPSGSVTTPFRHWHTFPITLSPGTHTIKLAGLNFGSSASFAAEIYDTTLSNFQANLMSPAVSAGNCGTTPAQLAPYIIFSTKDMVGKQVANPNSPGQWTCPDGGEVDFCNGTPSCYKRELLKLTCACYMIIPCNGTDAFVSNNDEFEDYVDGFVYTVSKELDFYGCAYVTKLDNNDCLDSIEAFPDPDPDVPCNCELQCYYVQGTNGFLYVDADDVLQEVTAIEATPYIKLCSKIQPVVENNSTNYQIVNLGKCVNDECPVLCFELKNCDTDEVIYSNSDTLLPYLYSNENIVKLIGKPGCWEVTLPTADCSCLIVTTTSFNPNYFPPFTATANAAGTYNGMTLYSFILDGTEYYIWYNEKDQWVFSFDGYGDNNLDFEYIAITTETQETCPVSIDGTIEWLSRREGVDTTTEKCPVECDCPIDVTVSSSYESCRDCIGYIAYKLKSCTNNDVIYTILNLEEYIGQVVKIDCGCYTVEQINYLPANPQIIKLEDIFTTCIECTRTYWKLTDCADSTNTIITYTDLALYVGKTIKIENCNECWIVSSTTDHLNATTVTVTNEYVDCEECGIPQDCICTTLINLSTIDKAYGYYDCENVYHEIVLKPNESTGKLCTLSWVSLPPYCSCIQFKLNGESYYAFVIPNEFINNKPVYNLCTDGEIFQCGTVYWDGTNWIIADPEGTPTWILPTSTSVLCPYGDWTFVKNKAKAAAPVTLSSQPCDTTACDCFTFTIEPRGITSTFYLLTIDSFGNPVYTDGTYIISYITKSGCWGYGEDYWSNTFTFCTSNTTCPIGIWSSQFIESTAVSLECPVPNYDFTAYDHFETFGKCQNGVCPPPVFKNNRTVRPGYNTPICTPDKYDEITCRFADILYKIALEKRYGITNCCPEEDDKWLIKKELIELQALKDPNYNCPDCICSCNSGNTCSTCNCKK